MEFPLRTMLLLSLGPLLSRATVTEEDIKVYQTADLEVVKGDSATLHCYWRAINHSLYRVNWNKTEVKLLHQPTAVRYDGEGCGSALSPVNHGTCGCATLTLNNVTRNHTGRYVCQVIRERPVLKHFMGNGTMITVTAFRDSDHRTGSPKPSPTNGTTQEESTNIVVPVVISLAVVMAAVFLITLICLRKLRKRQELDRAARVIYEVPHRDSEVDGTSTSSSKGSSQWCQVPVYESFDYFQHGVERKGSG